MWPLGETLTGVVSYWHLERGWGEIMRVDYGTERRWRQQIYVHNTQLPRDAKRRWLKCGERVRLTVGAGAMGRGPQALGVVGLAADGKTQAPLACQRKKAAASSRRLAEGTRGGG